jgi:hypothetical protein
MKRKINQAPMLTLPNLHNPFKVDIDASGYAMGEILMQGGRPIYYHFEVFHGVVLNYPTYEKESIFLVSSCQKVEELSNGKGDHHPHISLATTIFIGPK